MNAAKFEGTAGQQAKSKREAPKSGSGTVIVVTNIDEYIAPLIDQKDREYQAVDIADIRILSKDRRSRGILPHSFDVSIEHVCRIRKRKQSYRPDWEASQAS